MFSDPKLGAIVFFVTDLARSETFYRDVLGLPVQRMGNDDEEMLLAELGPMSLVFFVVTSRVVDPRSPCSMSVATTSKASSTP